MKDRLSGRVKHGEKPGRKPYLNSEEEKELVTHLLKASSLGYGKTRRHVCSIVEQYVEQKEDVSLRKDKITNGWWQKFLERNPSIRLRSGDSTAGIRLDAVNPENLNNYFDQLKQIYDEFNFEEHPEAIYNMDETGVPLEPRPPKVVAAKGQKKVRYQTSGKKEQITVVGCASATGQSIPPFLIFSGKQINYLWTKDEVTGSRFAVSDKGWIDHELFFHFIKDHFLVHAVPHHPLLLILDGHSTHFDLLSLHFAKDNGIIIFCLPPHTTHECQPLDCSLFKPLKDKWREECHKFYAKNPGMVINKFNFCRVFRGAWLSAVTPENIISGFRKGGIYPYNRNAILCVGSTTQQSEENPQTSTDGKENGEPNTQGMQVLLMPLCKCHFLVGERENDNNLSSDEGDRSAQTSRSCSLEFSTEEETKFARRFEEGYDLPDIRYQAWLSVNHPDAVNSEAPIYTLETGPSSQTLPGTQPLLMLPEHSLSEESSLIKSSNIPGAMSPSEPGSTFSDWSTPVSMVVTPSQTSDRLTEPTPTTPDSGSVINNNTRQTHSPLSDLVNIPTIQPKKTGFARVLTSSECLKALKDKEEKKRLVEEEKQRRKEEREVKKKQKEEEMKRKSELKAQKAATREAKLQDKQSRQGTRG